VATMRARAVTLRPFPVTEARRDGEVPRAKRRSLTDTPHSKTPGTSIHLHISKEPACHSQVLPLPGHHAPYFSRTSYTLLGAHYITAFPNQAFVVIVP